MTVTNIGLALRNAAREVAAFARIARGPRSTAAFAADAVAYRLMGLRPARSTGRERWVDVKPCVRLGYRRNRGDIQTLREVWIDRVYELPPGLRPETVLDLGANIGLSGVWFAHRYDSRVVAVEPSTANAALARANFQTNGVDGDVIEAAVGPHDGVARLEERSQPNLSRLGSHGHEVRVIGIRALLARTGPVDLVKLDVEGAEADLLLDPGWLEYCGAVIAELHGGPVERERLASRVVGQGFSFHPAGSLLPKTADLFLRC